jgi:uncharacterized protein YgbK (DUF1537 family)
MTSPLYAYYGDDFTGSTDVLEALASAGVPSVLFVGTPSEAQRARFAGCRAFGIAGDSRSRDPEWMSEHLPALFRSLGALGAPLVHYKTCSTFDSSPEIGSIGRALEIGRGVLPGPFIPIVVAAPHLGRYLVFGNLFAAAAGEVHRIDRHPTMRSHPVTPMCEADLRRHLAAQTALPIGSVELPALARGAAGEALAACLAAGDQAVLFDGVSTEDLAQTGRLLWRDAQAHRLFCAGSSGLTYALLAAWRQAAVIPAEAPAPASIRSADTLLVISGSCSPVTARQIQLALRSGYHGIALDPAALLNSGGAQIGESVVREAANSLRRGRSTVLYSAVGPLPAGAPPSGERLGRRMGELLARILAAVPQHRRVLLAGGDTSSHALTQLGLSALTWAGSLEPGAPLCRAHADGHSGRDGLELVLKGGQVGSEGFFERVRQGK